jgi:hypothetical protein
MIIYFNNKNKNTMRTLKLHTNLLPSSSLNLTSWSLNTTNEAGNGMAVCADSNDVIFGQRYFTPEHKQNKTERMRS